MKKLFLMFTICFMITCVMAPQVFATTYSESDGIDLSQTKDDIGLYSITAHGQYALSAKDGIVIDIEWQGSGSYLVLLTKEDYSVEEINELAQSGLLPIGSFENGINRELADKFRGIQMLLSMSNCNTIDPTIYAPDTGTYNLYSIAEADYTDVDGTFVVGGEQFNLV